jgi:predicted DsbA family dithiol-disulfide isomerase
VEVERLAREYPVDVRWAPFLLDPTVPPEGRPRQPYTKPGDPPSALELRGQRSGLTFTRGRTFQPNSHRSLELAAYARDAGHDGFPFHRALFRAHFETLENIGDHEVLLRIAAEQGLDPAATSEALETGAYRQQVDHELAWAQQLGVTAVPTFVFQERYAVVGAQEYPAFQRVMERLGHPVPPGVEPPPDGFRMSFGDEVADR